MVQTKIFKITTLILGIVAIGVGCHAYFESKLNKLNKDSDFHKACSLSILPNKCPPYSYESYFVAITIIAFILSLFLFADSFFITNDLLKRVNAPYHVVAGVLLLLGAIFMIVSAAQIYALFKPGYAQRNAIDYFDEKIAAGAICLINSFLYIFIGATGFKNRDYTNTFDS